MKANLQYGATNREETLPINETKSRDNSNTLNSGQVVPYPITQVNNQIRDATEEETKTLRHVNDRVPVAAWIVILAGAAERATYFGVIAPWRMLTGRPFELTMCMGS